MFGNLQGATISNLMLNNIDITGVSLVGGLAGKSEQETTITCCGAKGKIGNSGGTGGLVGDIYSTIVSYCYANVNIKGSGSRVGGMIGGCYSNSYINDCYSLGSVQGNKILGGLVGHVNNSVVLNSYSAGHVQGVSATGGLFGSISPLTFQAPTCCFDRNTSQQDTSAEGKGGRRETELMTKQDNYKKWDFINIWRISPKMENYPYLFWQNDNGVHNTPERVLHQENGLHVLNAEINTDNLKAVFKTTETPSNSRITCQYTTHPDIPIISSFADISSYRVYYRFDFTHPEQLVNTEYFLLQFNDQINHIWGRLDEGNWKELPFIEEEDGIHFTINNIEDLSSGTRNNYSAIEFVGGFKELYGLPVELSSFTIRQVISQTVELSWTSETETNLLGYNVYRSECNQLSQSVRINPAIIGGHNTSTQKRYSFEDSSVELEKE
jgi:hypothetical protein